MLDRLWFYALMRRQCKPVEMILIPDGWHGLSTPSERMVSLQGKVDWFKIRLQGERSSSPSLAAERIDSLRAQYDARDKMAALKRDDAKRPRRKADVQRSS